MRPRSCPHWHLKGFERECASNETVVDEVNERGMPQGEQCSAALALLAKVGLCIDRVAS